MSTDQSVAFATRLPSSEAAKLESVKVETDWTDATVVRRAIRYYIEENPDRINALYSEASVDRFMTDLLE